MTDFSLRKRPKKSIDKKVILVGEDLRRRARWAINYAADVHDLTNETMAPLIDSKIWTVANYRSMTTSPKAEFISNFCKKFDFSEVWFLKGKGEPFPGARAKHPEVCGPEETRQPPVMQSRLAPPTAPLPHPAAAIMPAPDCGAGGIDPAIQAMSDIKDIFASGDPILIPAIQANLNAFKRVLLREQQFNQVIQENKELREMMGGQELRITELEYKIKYLTDLQSGTSAGAS